MKILHTADIHLGAKNIKLSIDKQTLLKNQQNLDITKLFETAYQQDYDVILICGDLFHTKNVQSKIIDNFFNAVENFSRPVIYIKGNHDEKFSFIEIPKNFIILDDNNPSFEYNNSIFWGQVSPQLISQSLNKNKRNVLLLHGDIKNKNDRDYIDIEKYLNLPLDYIALGHVHSMSINKINGISYAYCGSLFSNGFDETGEKGFIEINLDEKGTNVKFIEFASYSYKIISCDISGLNTYKEILEKAKNSLEYCNTNDLVRLVLTGYYSENSEKYLHNLENDLSNYFYFEILDKTKLKIDFDKIKNEELSFKTEFLLLVEQNEKDEETKNKICQIGIEALRGDDLSL